MKSSWFTPEFEKFLDEEVARALEILKDPVTEPNFYTETAKANVLGYLQKEKATMPDRIINEFGFVQKYYLMNPDTEEILFDGAELRDGMKVLIEDPQLRETITDRLGEDPAAFAHAMQMNRWCTVSDFTSDFPNIEFIATYEDETQRKMTVDSKKAWIVKMASIPEDERLASIRTILTDLIGDPPVHYKVFDVHPIVTDAAERILRIFTGL